jgi:hypothetical protein
MKEQSVFATLYGLAVKDKIERKGHLDYLSWANAWALLKANYPDAQRKVYEHDHTGLNFFTDGTTAYVKVGIIVNGIEHIDYLPVMDHRNNAIPVAKVTSTDVNKTIQRSTAKAIAMHGLGLSLWTGEDIADIPSEKLTAKKVVESAKSNVDELGMILLEKGTEDWDRVVKYVKENKALGLDKIGQQLTRKYKITPSLKNEIVELLK